MLTLFSIWCSLVNIKSNLDDSPSMLNLVCSTIHCISPCSTAICCSLSPHDPSTPCVCHSSQHTSLLLKLPSWWFYYSLPTFSSNTPPFRLSCHYIQESPMLLFLGDVHHYEVSSFSILFLDFQSSFTLPLSTNNLLHFNIFLLYESHSATRIPLFIPCWYIIITYLIHHWLCCIAQFCFH